MNPRIIYEAPRRAPRPGEIVVTSTCGHNCGGRCAVNAHVRDGQIVKISTDPRKWTPERPPLHACVRGFGQLERVNHPDRLRHPLRIQSQARRRGAGQGRQAVVVLPQPDSPVKHHQRSGRRDVRGADRGAGNH
jgi:anaerobic dimethyl sulfoxide reductase subunit A